MGIMEQLNKIKEALINAGKKVLIQITDDIVKIIVGDSAGSSYSGLEKRGITDIWNQVKNAVKSAAEKVQDYLNDKMDVLKPKIMDALANAKADFNNAWAKVEQAFKDLDAHIKAKVDEYKPQIIEALNKFQEDVEDYKDFVIEEGNKIIIRINKFGVKIVEDAQNVMDKLSDDVRGYVKAKVEELKPQIIEELNKGKQIIVDAVKGVVIQIRDQIVRIITGAQTGSSDEVATYGALDGLWEKIKAVAIKLSPDVLKIIKEAGPKLAESLKKLGAIVIKLKGEIIRIIDAEEIAESSDEFAMEKRGIKDIWAKVKAAVKKLGDDIRGRVETAIDELKPQILDSLNKIKEVTINAGKKVII